MSAPNVPSGPGGMIIKQPIIGYDENDDSLVSAELPPGATVVTSITNPVTGGLEILIGDSKLDAVPVFEGQQLSVEVN